MLNTILIPLNLKPTRGMNMRRIMHVLLLLNGNWINKLHEIQQKLEKTQVEEKETREVLTTL